MTSMQSEKRPNVNSRVVLASRNVYIIPEMIPKSLKLATLKFLNVIVDYLK